MLLVGHGGRVSTIMMLEERRTVSKTEQVLRRCNARSAEGDSNVLFDSRIDNDGAERGITVPGTIEDKD